MSQHAEKPGTSPAPGAQSAEQWLRKNVFVLPGKDEVLTTIPAIAKWMSAYAAAERQTAERERDDSDLAFRHADEIVGKQEAEIIRLRKALDSVADLAHKVILRLADSKSFSGKEFKSQMMRFAEIRNIARAALSGSEKRKGG
jgi:hypothetical protein